jgi:hypothetical protein
MRTERALQVLFWLLWLLVACSPAPTTIEPGESPDFSETPTTVVGTVPTSPAPDTPAQPQAAGTGTPEPAPAHPYAGLAFTNAEGLWLVNEAGVAELLLPRQQAILSQDGRYVAYLDGPPDGSQQDIYLLDRQTGETRNLTATPDRNENAPLFWEANPGVLLFESKSIDEPLFGFGQPSMVNLDGGGYTVLDETAAGPISAGQDGATLAFGCCDVPGQIYRLGQGSSPFFPESYGISAEKLFMPALSPDGNSLAWILSGRQPGTGEITMGVAVFNLQEQTGKWVHGYTPQGGTEFNGALAWSQDGQLLAYVNQGEVAGLGRAPALWLIRVDGSGEMNLGSGHNPVWSPQGDRLAFSLTPQDFQAQRVYVYTPWDESAVETPFQGVVVAWIE